MTKRDPRHEQDSSDPADWYRPSSTGGGRAESAPVDANSRMKQIHQISLMLHRPDESDFSQPTYRKTYNESDQRQFMRCKLTGEQTHGVFNIGGKRFPCRLIEMSIGGFGILIAGSPRFAPGAIGSLRAPNLSYVVSISRLEPGDGSCFVGLKQVEEVLDHSLRLPGEPTANAGYLISIVSGLMIAVLSYVLMAAM